MRTIAKIFGRSPFVPLQSHMEKVAACVEMVKPIIVAYAEGKFDVVEEMAAETSRLEHAADQLKHDIQSQLPKGIFMPVDRDRLLEILAIQDNIADKAENIAVLLTLKQMPIPPMFEGTLNQFLDKNLETFQGAKQIIAELDELLSSGFGGAEAQKVREMVMHVATLEHEADRLQAALLKELFSNEDDLSVAGFFLFERLFKQISGLSNTSERLAHRIRRTLELK